MQAWKRPDGRYTLVGGGVKDKMVLRGLVTRGWATYDPDSGNWTASAETVGLAKIEKVFGVITGPSSCGCEPAMFRWVGEQEVARGNTCAKRCPDCMNPATNVPEIHSCDIIEVLGEPDVARAVYESEFRDKIEALT